MLQQGRDLIWVLLRRSTKQMAKGGLGIDENGVFTQLQRPGTRADGSSSSDFHVMRGSQGSAANTSSRRTAWTISCGQ